MVIFTFFSQVFQYCMLLNILVLSINWRITKDVIDQSFLSSTVHHNRDIKMDIVWILHTIFVFVMVKKSNSTLITSLAEEKRILWSHMFGGKNISLRSNTKQSSVIFQSYFVNMKKRNDSHCFCATEICCAFFAINLIDNKKNFVSRLQSRF